MNFLRFTAVALLTCGLAATYTFAAEEKPVTAEAQAKDHSSTLQIRKAIAEDVSLSDG